MVLLGPTDLLVRVDDQNRIFSNSINLGMQFQPARIRVDKAILKKNYGMNVTCIPDTVK